MSERKVNGKISNVLVLDVRAYFNEKFDELDRRLDLRYQLTDAAVKKSESALEERLERMNEFRSQLEKQAATFVQRNELELKMESINSKIDTLSKLIYMGVGGVLLLQLITGIAALIFHFIKL